MLPAPRDPLPPRPEPPPEPSSLASLLAELLRGPGAQAARALDGRADVHGDGAVLAEVGLADGDDVAALVQLAYAAKAAGRGRGEWLEDVVVTLGRTVHVIRECGGAVLHARLDPARGDIGAVRRALAAAELEHAVDVAMRGVSQSDLFQSDLSQPDLFQPDLSQSDLSQSDLSQPDVSETEVSRSDVSRPDVSQSGVSQSDVSQSDVSQSEVTVRVAPVGADPDRFVRADAPTLPSMRPVRPSPRPRTQVRPLARLPEPAPPPPQPPPLPRPRPADGPARAQEPALTRVDGSAPSTRAGALAVLALPPVAVPPEAAAPEAAAPEADPPKAARPVPVLPRRRPAVPSPPGRQRAMIGPPVLRQPWASDVGTMQRLLAGLERMG